MNAYPPDRLLAQLTRHGDVFYTSHTDPSGHLVQNFSLFDSPTAEWHTTHWKVNDRTYPPHAITTITRLLTQPGAPHAP